ncbi:MAG: hypothetical protein ACREFR_13785 [Limisphaerales bacterium]
MTKPSYRIGLATDFNSSNLAALLRRSRDAEVHCVETPYGQLTRLLSEPNDPFWKEAGEAVLLWSLPQLAIPTFQKVIRFEEFSVDELLEQVKSFCGQIEKIPAEVSTLLLPSWIMPWASRGLGPLDLSSVSGVANVLGRMNQRLVEHFRSQTRIVLLDATRWLGSLRRREACPEQIEEIRTGIKPAEWVKAPDGISLLLELKSGQSQTIRTIFRDTMENGAASENTFAGAGVIHWVKATLRRYFCEIRDNYVMGKRFSEDRDRGTGLPGSGLPGGNFPGSGLPASAR